MHTLKVPKISAKGGSAFGGKNKKRFIVVTSIVVVVLGITALIVIGQIRKPSPYEFAIATKQTVTQEVSITGKVAPAQAVDLAFEKGGKIKQVYAYIGDFVTEGESLVSLNTSELQAQLTQAQASLESQEATLAELEKGTRAEEIDVAQTSFDNAQKALVDVQNKATSDLVNLYDDVKDTLNDSYAKANDAVDKQTEELFSNDYTNSPTLTFSCFDYQSVVNSQNQRVQARDALSEIKSLVDSSSVDFAFLDTALTKTENNLIKIRDFLNTLNTALNSANSISASTASTYKGYVNTGRTNVNTALTSVNALRQSIVSQKLTNQQNITTAQNTLESAQKNLTLKQAGATQEQLQVQMAQVKSARANVDNITAQITKSIIKAPFAGTIIKQEAKVGEIAQAGSIIVSLISQSEFEVEVNVPEADTAKVKIGDTAKITLDAYGSSIYFKAVVVKINPSETIIEGVATYKTTLQFVEKDERIKSGFTANVDILTAQKENVLAVPYRAVVSKNGDKIVRILNGKVVEERKVKIGLRGSDGYIEIIEGLEEGTQVITFEKNK